MKDEMALKKLMEMSEENSEKMLFLASETKKVYNEIFLKEL